MTKDQLHQSCSQDCCNGRLEGFLSGQTLGSAGGLVDIEAWQGSLDSFEFRRPLLAGFSFEEKQLRRLQWIKCGKHTWVGG